MAIEDISATELAEKINISRNSIQSIKNQKTTMIRISTLHKLINYFNCSYDDFFDTSKFKKQIGVI